TGSMNQCIYGTTESYRFQAETSILEIFNILRGRLPLGSRPFGYSDRRNNFSCPPRSCARTKDGEQPYRRSPSYSAEETPAKALRFIFLPAFSNLLFLSFLISSQCLDRT